MPPPYGAGWLRPSTTPSSGNALLAVGVILLCCACLWTVSGWFVCNQWVLRADGAVEVTKTLDYCPATASARQRQALASINITVRHGAARRGAARCGISTGCCCCCCCCCCGGGGGCWTLLNLRFTCTRRRLWASVELLAGPRGIQQLWRVTATTARLGWRVGRCESKLIEDIHLGCRCSPSFVVGWMND